MMSVLKIYGDIGEAPPPSIFDSEPLQNTSAKLVSEFLDEHKDSTEIVVKINSRGGDVQEGWAIHDLLVSSGKKIKTIGEGKVYSIATIIFLAGSEREMMKNADGLIHNPYIPEYTLADSYTSDELTKIADGLIQEEEKILEFYTEKTGADKAKLAEYMKEDTKLSAEDMLSLGFATKIIEPIKAYAYLKPKIKTMDEKDVKTFGEKLDAIIAKVANFSRLPSMDQTITDKDGKQMKLDKESGEPAIGDKASPDGVYVMTSGNTITVAGGVVTKIDTVESELTKANAKIAELEAKIALAETEKVNLIAAESSFKTKEAEAKAMVEELASLKNSWKPESRSKFSSVDKVGDIDLNKVKAILDKIKSKIE